MKHSLERTSPKGGKFIGTCTLCGVAGLTIADSQKDCENVRGLTNEEAVLEAIKGPSVNTCPCGAGEGDCPGLDGKPQCAH